MNTTSGMEIFTEGTFYNPTRGNLQLPEVLREILAYMREIPDAKYEVIVGCDSSAREEEPNFPVAIVVLRNKQGGRFFLKRVKYTEGRTYFSFHDRILQEVLLSCQLALWLREELADLISREGNGLSYVFEHIHADVGPEGRTKATIQEVTGLIKGYQFTPQIKPDSFAASSVADRFVN